MHRDSPPLPLVFVLELSPIEPSSKVLYKVDLPNQFCGEPLLKKRDGASII